MVIAKRGKAYAALAGVFLLGALAGGGTVWAVSQREVRAFVAGERGAFEHRRLKALSRELDLTSEQQDKISAIFEKHREEQRALMQSMSERCGEPMRAHRKKVIDEINAVLTPEQRERHEQLMREHEGRPFGFPGPMGGPPGPHPGPPGPH
jgi:Spy/CpxP family protein refolding chaperone